MSGGVQRRIPVAISKKLKRKLPEGHEAETDALGEEALRASIIRLEKEIAEIEGERDEDEKLLGAKALARDLSQPYRDSITVRRAKIAYALDRLEHVGTSVPNP